MSKTINNYRGKHIGWKQNKPMIDERKKKGVPPIMMMWMNYAVKMRKFLMARAMLRDQLAVKGKKALTGKKRQRVLDKYFAVRYA